MDERVKECRYSRTCRVVENDVVENDVFRRRTEAFGSTKCELDQQRVQCMYVVRYVRRKERQGTGELGRFCKTHELLLGICRADCALTGKQGVDDRLMQAPLMCDRGYNLNTDIEMRIHQSFSYRLIQFPRARTIYTLIAYPASNIPGVSDYPSPCPWIRE